MDSFANSIESLEPFLADCIAETVSLVPEEQRASTRVYLGATAGMRVLSAEQPELAEAILDE